MWKETQFMNGGSKALTNYTLEPAIPYTEIKKRIRFHLFLEPIIKDPRFEMDFHIPADLESYKYFHQNNN